MTDRTPWPMVQNGPIPERDWDDDDRIMVFGPDKGVGLVPTGGIQTAANALGPGSVARSIEDELRDLGRPVGSFGALGDGTTDDSDALEDALNSGYPIIIPPVAGYYKITRHLNITASNLRIYGAGRKSRILNTSSRNVLRFASDQGITSATDVKIENIALESSYSSTTNDVYGLITCNNISVLDWLLSGIYFSAPNCMTNAIKVVLDDPGGANRLRRFKMQHCLVDGIGRMGIEVQSHLGDSVARIFDLEVLDSTFKDLGQVTPATGNPYGTPVSVSGDGKGAICRGLVVDNPLDIGIEYAGTLDAVSAHDITFRNLSRRCAILGWTGTPITNAKASHITVEGQASDAKIFLGRVNNSVIDQINADLGFVTSGYGYLEMRGCVSTKVRKSDLVCRGIYGALFSRDTGASVGSSDNLIEDSTIDSSAISGSGGALAGGASYIAAARFDGVGVEHNELRRTWIKRANNPAGGGRFSEANSAQFNRMVDCGYDTVRFNQNRRNPQFTSQPGGSAATVSVAEQEAQYLFHRLTSSVTLTQKAECYFPHIGREIIIWNNTTGGQDVLVRPANGNTGVTIPNGAVYRILLIIDETTASSSTAQLVGVAIPGIGTAAPTTTPTIAGQMFIDTTNDKAYVATGTASSSDWTVVN